jgi:cytochrome b
MKQLGSKQSVLVWDMPVRVFHWLLVISFVGAWVTSESEAQPMIHYAFGYTASALVLFRIIWGILGTRYARFNQFIKGPSQTILHIKSLVTRNPNPELGHNPAGALAMVLLMLLILLIGLTGYGLVKDFLGDLAGEAHEAIASIAMAVVVVHIAAAVGVSFLQKENLVKSMVTGKKQGTTEQAIRSSAYGVGILLVGAYAYFFYQILNGALPALTH